MNNISKIKDLEVGLNNLRTTKKINHFINTKNVQKYIDSFHEEGNLRPSVDTSQQKLMSQSVLQPAKIEVPTMNEAYKLDHIAGTIGSTTYNPYTKEKIVIVNRSVDLRDHPSFENMGQKVKSPVTLVDGNNPEDSLVKAKQDQGYLSLPKILGLKSKSRLRNITNQSVILNK